jgi:hypothetical protein
MPRSGILITDPVYSNVNGVEVFQHATGGEFVKRQCPQNTTEDECGKYIIECEDGFYSVESVRLHQNCFKGSIFEAMINFCELAQKRMCIGEYTMSEIDNNLMLIEGRYEELELKTLSMAELINIRDTMKYFVPNYDILADEKFIDFYNDTEKEEDEYVEEQYDDFTPYDEDSDIEDSNVEDIYEFAYKD